MKRLILLVTFFFSCSLAAGAEGFGASFKRPVQYGGGLVAALFAGYAIYSQAQITELEKDIQMLEERKRLMKDEGRLWAINSMLVNKQQDLADAVANRALALKGLAGGALAGLVGKFLLGRKKSSSSAIPAQQSGVSTSDGATTSPSPLVPGSSVPKYTPPGSGKGQLSSFTKPNSGSGGSGKNNKKKKKTKASQYSSYGSGKVIVNISDLTPRDKKAIADDKKRVDDWIAASLQSPEVAAKKKMVCLGAKDGGRAIAEFPAVLFPGHDTGGMGHCGVYTQIALAKKLVDPSYVPRNPSGSLAEVAARREHWVRRCIQHVQDELARNPDLVDYELSHDDPAFREEYYWTCRLIQRLDDKFGPMLEQAKQSALMPSLRTQAGAQQLEAAFNDVVGFVELSPSMHKEEKAIERRNKGNNVLIAQLKRQLESVKQFMQKDLVSYLSAPRQKAVLDAVRDALMRGVQDGAYADFFVLQKEAVRMLRPLIEAGLEPLMVSPQFAAFDHEIRKCAINELQSRVTSLFEAASVRVLSGMKLRDIFGDPASADSATGMFGAYRNLLCGPTGASQEWLDVLEFELFAEEMKRPVILVDGPTNNTGMVDLYQVLGLQYRDPSRDLWGQALIANNEANTHWTPRWKAPEFDAIVADAAPGVV